MFVCNRVNLMSAKQAKAAAAAAAAAANNAQSSASLVFNSNAALDPQAFLMATKLAESTGNTVQIVQMPGGQPAAVLLQPQQAHLAAAAGVGVIPTARLQNPFGLAGIGVGLAQLPNGLALAHQSMPPPAASPHEEEHRKTLSRRPSYRKILNEIADQRAGVKSEGVDEDSESDDGGEPPAHRARSSRGALAQSHADASAAAQGVLGFQIPQSLAGATTLGLPGQQAAILQYAQQGPDGQFYIPGTCFSHSHCISLLLPSFLESFTVSTAPAATALQQVAAYQVAGANSAAPGFFVAASQSTVQLQTNASQSQVRTETEIRLNPKIKPDSFEYIEFCALAGFKCT